MEENIKYFYDVNNNIYNSKIAIKILFFKIKNSIQLNNGINNN